MGPPVYYSSWEVTLGLPDCWWCYRDEAMIGKFIDAWSGGEKYPLKHELAQAVVVAVDAGR